MKTWNRCILLASEQSKHAKQLNDRRECFTRSVFGEHFEWSDRLSSENSRQRSSHGVNARLLHLLDFIATSIIFSHRFSSSSQRISDHHFVFTALKRIPLVFVSAIAFRSECPLHIIDHHHARSVWIRLLRWPHPRPRPLMPCDRYNLCVSLPQSRLYFSLMLLFVVCYFIVPTTFVHIFSSHVMTPSSSLRCNCESYWRRSNILEFFVSFPVRNDILANGRRRKKPIRCQKRKKSFLKIALIKKPNIERKINMKCTEIWNWAETKERSRNDGTE